LQFFTLSDLIEKLNARLNLSGETFITTAEKIEYINEGIKEAEAEIHKMDLEDNYFRASQPLELAVDQSSYGLPTNIYANKILKIIYSSGGTIYEIRRLRRRNNSSVEEQIANIAANGSSDSYQYYVNNDSAAFGNEIVLTPTSRETSSTAAKIWYIRQANVLAVDADICDIPEFYYFVLQYAKVMCLRKEFTGSTIPEGDFIELQRLRKLMISTLEEMVPDEDNKIDQDTQFYDDFNSWNSGFGGDY